MLSLPIRTRMIDFNAKQYDIATLFFLSPATPAVISPQPNSYTVDHSEAITFTCIATGFPLPEISWARVNSTSTVQLESDSSLTISESNVIPNYTLSDGSVVLAVARTLMFTSVSEEDSGRYSCVATNGVGADARDYFLIVRGEMCKVNVHFHALTRLGEGGGVPHNLNGKLSTYIMHTGVYYG